MFAYVKTTLPGVQVFDTCLTDLAVVYSEIENKARSSPHLSV